MNDMTSARYGRIGGEGDRAAEVEETERAERVEGTERCDGRAASRVRGPAGVALRAVRARLRAGDEGMTTSEYAVGTVAACGFAALLYRIVTSDAVKAALESVVGKALGVQV